MVQAIDESEREGRKGCCWLDAACCTPLVSPATFFARFALY